MRRRVVSYALWGFFGWYAAAYVMAVLALPAMLAPLGGAVMIAIAAVDWPAFVRSSVVAPATKRLDSPHRSR